MNEKKEFELEKKFGRICIMHRHINLEVINKVYEAIKLMKLEKRDITATNISAACNLKRTIVIRRLRLLMEFNYIKVIKKYSAMFLSVFDVKGDHKKPVYGRDNIYNEMSNNYNKLKEILLSNLPLVPNGTEKLNKLDEAFKETKRSTHFLKLYNEVTKILVLKEFKLVFMEFKSGAYRYSLD